VLRRAIAAIGFAARGVDWGDEMIQIGLRPGSSTGGRILLALLAAGLVLVSAGSASAASLGWSPELPPESTGGSAIRADALACPSTVQCTAVDTQGQEDTFDPQQPAPAEAATVDWGSALSGIACPSISQCTAVDNHGYEFTFDPREQAAVTSWRASSVSLSDVACVSDSDCVAVGNPQQTAVAFDPQGSVGSIDLATEETDGLGAVSCPTSSQCTATAFGNELTFDPLQTGDEDRGSELVPLDSGGWIGGVACPSSSQCTAVEDEGSAITFDPSSPLTREITPIGIWSWGVSCPSSDQCTAVGEVDAVTFDPLDPGSALVASDSGGGFTSAIACPSLTQCTIVAGDEETTFDPQVAPAEGPAPLGSGISGEPDGSVQVDAAAAVRAQNGASKAPSATSFIRSSSGSVLKVSRGRTAISLQCVGQSACQIEVDLLGGQLGRAADASGDVRSLAQARRTIPAHQSRRISIALTRSALRLLRAHRGRLVTRLVIDGTGGAAPIHLSRAVSLALGSDFR
jgi:hypothetical protein